MTISAKTLPVVVLFLLVSACGEKTIEIRGATMGTWYSIKYYGPVSKEKLQSQVDTTLARINSAMSTYDKTSEISRFNQLGANQWFKVSTNLALVLQAALLVSRASEGYFDITAGTLVNLWGFGPGGRVQKVPAASQLRKALADTGYQNLVFDLKESRIKKKRAGVYVDLSAIAKGFAVDQVAGLLEVKAIENYLVEIGGELRAKGSNQGRPWRVGIEKPDETSRAVQKVVSLRDKALATSGNYRNFYQVNDKKVAHTINVKTGRPVETSLASVSVLHDTCMMADAFATAIMAMPLEKALAWPGENNIAALLMVQEKGGVVEKISPALNNYLTLEKKP